MHTSSIFDHITNLRPNHFFLNPSQRNMHYLMDENNECFAVLTAGWLANMFAAICMYNMPDVDWDASIEEIISEIYMRTQLTTTDVDTWLFFFAPEDERELEMTLQFVIDDHELQKCEFTKHGSIHQSEEDIDNNLPDDRLHCISFDFSDNLVVERILDRMEAIEWDHYMGKLASRIF